LMKREILRGGAVR